MNKITIIGVAVIYSIVSFGFLIHSGNTLWDWFTVTGSFTLAIGIGDRIKKALENKKLAINSKDQIKSVSELFAEIGKKLISISVIHTLGEHMLWNESRNLILFYINHEWRKIENKLIAIETDFDNNGVVVTFIQSPVYFIEQRLRNLHELESKIQSDINEFTIFNNPINRRSMLNTEIVHILLPLPNHHVQILINDDKSFNEFNLFMDKYGIEYFKFCIEAINSVIKDETNK